MRTPKTWLIALLSLSLFGCGEPSFIGSAGNVPIFSSELTFYITDYAGNRIDGGNLLAPLDINGDPTLTTPETFTLHWDIDYGAPVDLTIQVHDFTTTNLPVNLFPKQTCSSESATCKLVNQSTACTYDNVLKNVTCDIASLNPGDLTGLDLTGTVYITFEACGGPNNCASADAILVNFK